MDFSTSTNPLGPHRAVIECIQDRNIISRYPDAAAIRLEEALAEYTNTPQNMVVAGNGATEIIHIICRIMAGRHVSIVTPAFSEYMTAATLNDSTTTITGTDQPTIPEKGLLFVGNPSNPHGTLLSSHTILEMVRACHDAGTTIVVDECFIEMTPNRNESILPYIKEHDNVIILRSMTKSFGLAGLRLGYAISTQADTIRRFRIPWSINGMAQIAGIEALQHTDHIQESLRIIQEETHFLHDTIPNSCHTDANYMTIRVPDAHITQEQLLKHDILVRDCSSFGLPTHIRIGIKTRRENTILARAMNKICPP